MSLSQAFAEQYTGRKAKINSSGVIGLITAWLSMKRWPNHILLEVIYKPEDVICLKWPSNYTGNYVFVRPIYNINMLYAEADVSDITLLPITIMPDDCDDCGAVGEQICKSNCPNRE